MSDGRPLAELVDAPVHDAWLSDAVRAAGRPSGDAAEAVLRLRLAQRVERVAQACRIEATPASAVRPA